MWEYIKQLLVGGAIVALGAAVALVVFRLILGNNKHDDDGDL